MDGRDEWAWAEESEAGPAPRALPVPGGWRPGAAEVEAAEAAADDMADSGAGREGEGAAYGSSGAADDSTGAAGSEEGGEVGEVEKVLLVRTRPAEKEAENKAENEAEWSVAATAHEQGMDSAAAHATVEPTVELTVELFVKWKGLAHVHCQWVPRAVLDASSVGNRRRVAKFVKDVRLALPSGVLLGGADTVVANADGLLSDGDEVYNPSYDEVRPRMASDSC